MIRESGSKDWRVRDHRIRGSRGIRGLEGRRLEGRGSDSG